LPAVEESLSPPRAVKKYCNDPHLLAACSIDNPQHSAITLRDCAKRANDVVSNRIRFYRFGFNEGAFDPRTFDAPFGHHELGVSRKYKAMFAHMLFRRAMERIL
jgi:hypothetical protein